MQSRAAALSFLLPSLLALSLLSVPASAGWPVGSRIDNSVLVDVTDEGFDSAEGLLGAFLPPRIDVPVVSQADEGGCVFGACAYSYSIYADDIYAEVQVGDLSITPGSGVLNLQATAVVTVNSPSDPAVIEVEAEAIGIDISDTCYLHVTPVTVQLQGAVQLQLLQDPAGIDVDGDGSPDTKRLDVNVPPLNWSWNASGNNIQVDDCAIDTINSVTSFFGLDLYEILLEQVEPQIDELINELPAEIEPTLEEAFAGLLIEQELDLLDIPINLTLWPDTLEIQQGGLRVGLASVTDAPVHPCVEKYGITESATTGSGPLAIGEVPASVPFPAHIAASIDDDFVNQVLFAVWAGGLLCFELENGSEDLPISLPIDTSLLNFIAPGVFEDLFPQTAPLVIRTEPTMPPVVVAEGPHDVNVVADGLGLDFYVELDGRKTRLMGIDLRADVGLDLEFEGSTGNLAVETTPIDASAFTTAVSYNEFRPDGTDTIISSFGALIDQLVGPLVGDSLEGLAFAIPGFEGIGVTDLVADPTGQSGDMIGAFITTGPVSYASGGCDESGGCDSSCEGGCSTGAPSGRIALLVFPLAAAWLRRRRTL